VSRITSINEADKSALESLERTGERLVRVREAINQIIFGQEKVVDLALTAILSGGHALLVGAPGLAKTKLATSLGKVLGLAERRVQFTPDLMPADILGAEILEETEMGRRQFRFVQGPVFCQLLMADEINRASPRTQSALLQAMQEKHVTVAGVRHDLPSPFHVLATQNPIEHEGTYPLPEAQLDRFLLEIDVPYPSLDAERRMLFATTGASEEEAQAVMSAKELLAAQHLVRVIPVGESVSDAVLKLVRSARPQDTSDKFVKDNVAWGPSPRASQALMLGAKARALLDGRLSP
jgi:MoxR-like ATPase